LTLSAAAPQICRTRIPEQEAAMADLCDLEAVELRRLIGAGEVSPVDLVESCIARIEAADPAVNAITAKAYDRARAEARAAEAAVQRGDALGPLHGLPIGVKDLSDTEGLLTAYGSPLFADNVPAADERVVAVLRQAGAIVLAKTNTPEFGAGANTRNEVFGPTLNPFDHKLTCAGSSGGSAVALACGMVPLATGSDLAGSLRTPAAYCGIVGFRPTPGLIPTETRGHGWSPLSVDGPMARTVTDAALMLSAMVGHDPRDPLSLGVEGEPFRVLSQVDLGGLTVAFTEDLGFAPVDSRVRRSFRAARQALEPAVGRSVDFAVDMGGLRHAARCRLRRRPSREGRGDAGQGRAERHRQCRRRAEARPRRRRQRADGADPGGARRRRLPVWGRCGDLPGGRPPALPVAGLVSGHDRRRRPVQLLPLAGAGLRPDPGRPALGGTALRPRRGRAALRPADHRPPPRRPCGAVRRPRDRGLGRTERLWSSDSERGLTIL
jgi:Asp-tRNA(Asn)/Glu-tRNA(Gln) amidotransferase A subunit family amidase